MSETAENTEVAKAEHVEQPEAAAPVVVADIQQPLTPQGQEVAKLLNFVKEYPEAAQDPKIKEVLDQMNAFAKNKPQAVPAAEQPVVDLAEKNKQAKEEEKKVEKSVFYNKPTDKVEFKTPDDWKKYIEDKYSMKDESKFFQTVDKWRKDSQDKSDVEKIKESYERVFDEMPDPIYDALNLWGKGDSDWASKLKVPSFDYSRDFNKQNTYDLINHYFPGKFEKDDFAGEYKDLEVTAQRAIDVAKEKFDLEKTQFTSKRAEVQKRADENLQKLRTSASGSVKKLEQSFPDFDRQDLNKIERRLNSGDINSMFFNKDGTYKEDAAESAALVEFGKREIARLNALLESSQRQLQEAVSRKSDNPTVRGSQDATITPDKKSMDRLQELVPKQYY